MVSEMFTVTNKIALIPLQYTNYYIRKMIQIYLINLDLEAAGKKKKKKKKPFNFDDLDGALPDKDDGTPNDATAQEETGGIEDDFNLDMDFSKTKKKKKKKKDLDELVAEEEKEKAEEKDNGKY